ncbi:MAG: nucleotide exchange factor GrpE [Candidatus Paceibacterota bacterium]
MKNNPKKVKKSIDETDLEFYNEDTPNQFDIDPEEDFGEQAEETIRGLKKKLKESEREKIENLTGWQRSKADYINLKKRSAEGSERLGRQAKESVIKTFFPVLDSLELSMKGEAWENANEKWRSGIESIYKQFISALSQNNVEEIGEIGEQFDPYIHTSISMRKTENPDEDNTVAEVVQRGYRFKQGEVIRSPKVVVFEMTL